MKHYAALTALFAAIALIAAGCGGGGGGGASLTITPSSVTLTTGGMRTFTASEAVTWQVAELGGGTVTTAGVYTAPSTAGTYHLIATSKTDSSRIAIATIFVSTSTAGLIVDPTNPALGVYQTIVFSANMPVTWRVQEVGGGTIRVLTETTAEYTAPGAGGDFHVIATSKADTTTRVTVTVFVGDAPPPPPG